MSRQHHILIAAMLVGSAFPLAGAYAFDANDEPNTDHDKVVDSNGDPKYLNQGGFNVTDKIYFDAVNIPMATVFFTPVPYNGITVGPKGVARVFGPAPSVTNFAYLGWWKDCNNDGYVGQASTGFAVYDGDGSPNCSDTDPASFNDHVNDGKVYEFIWIGDVDSFDGECDGCAPAEEELCVIQPDVCTGVSVTLDDPDTHVDDHGARIWGDWFLPDEPVPVVQGIVPLPPGTLSTTGGAITWVDDATLQAISGVVNVADPSGDTWKDLTCADDGTANAPLPSPVGHTTPEFSPDDSTCGALNFPNPVGYYAREAWNNRVSATNSEADQASPRYNSDGSSAWVTMWDCDADPVGVEGVAQVADPGNPDVNFDVGDNPPYGSLHGQFAEINYGLGNLGAGGNFECEDTPGSPLPWNSLETSSQASRAGYRNQHDMAYQFITRTVVESDGTGAVGSLTGSFRVEDETGYFDKDVFGGYWFGREAWTQRPPRTLQGALQVTHITTYAKITGAAWSEGHANLVGHEGTPLGAIDQHRYGEEGCGGSSNIVDIAGTPPPSHLSPLGNGWECNIASWEFQRATNEELLDQYIRVVLDDTYTFRDVDCYDNYSGIDDVYLGTNGLTGDCFGNTII